MAFSNKKYSHKSAFCECSRCEETAGVSVRKKLLQLPEIKAKPGFDQKMAAAFAQELEMEVSKKNQAWLKKSKNIRLPEIVSDFRREFL